MVKIAKLLILTLALVSLTFLFGCAGLGHSAGTNNPGPTGPTGPTTPPPADITAVNHVVIILQENRSFDSYFGKLNDYLKTPPNGVPAYPQAGQIDGIPASGFNNSGIGSYHSGSVCMENMSPDWAEDRHEVNLNNPKGIVPGNTKTMPMDGFVNTAAGIAAFYSFQDTVGRRAMGYYTDHELNYYYFLAANFGVGDKFYSPAPTNTPNNRIYMFGATSQGTIHTPGGTESCPGEPGQMASKPQAGLPNSGKPIFQVLSEKNIDWKIYITDLTPACDPKNGNFPLTCAIKSTYLQFFGYINCSAGRTCDSTGAFNADVLKHLAPLDCSGGVPAVAAHPTYKCPAGVTDYFTDVKNKTLPAVAFIETGGFSGRDEHPSGRDLASTTIGCNGITGQTCISIEFGAQFASHIIDALMASPSWDDSVFFWAADEGGGAFDHVPPMAVTNPDGIKPFLCPLGPTGDLKDVNVGGDFTITGFRVPNMVISPFSKKNFVSHTPMDYTAILKFIETRWQLGPLTLRDQQMPDMTEFFDFTNKPWATPPTTPKQNTGNSTCDFSKE